jgi:peptide/nickel transport system substrate-binding protein
MALDRSRRLGIAVAGVFGCLLASGCGSGSHAGSGTATNAAVNIRAGGAAAGLHRPYAVLRLAWGVPDFLDPGMSYDARGWNILEHVYLGLLTYRPVSGAGSTQLMPGLAESLPAVSDGGLTYTFVLRPGLRYSSGRPVRASDFGPTIERVIRLGSAGATFYDVIAGATRFAASKTGHISGITADDATRTIRIHLTKPRGDFENLIAMMFASLVPAETPAKDQSTTPIPAMGPYMITSYRPNQSFTLERNPYWSQIPGIPNGNPDAVQGTIYSDDAHALQQVIEGQADFDQHTVPPDRIALVKRQYGGQLRLFVPAGTRYFFLNQAVRPFNSLLVRRAVNYAIDRQAVVGLYGGLALPTQNYLPPSYPSYEKISYYSYDPAIARALVSQAGDAGVPVTVWGLSDDDIARNTIAYLTSQLNAIGLRASEKLLQSSAYWGAIFDPSKKAQIGWNEWVQDYPHPADWFDLVLNGANIQKTNNYDVGMVNVSALNHRIEALDQLPADGSTDPTWAALDRAFVVNDAAMAPYVNEVGTDFFSSRMDLKNCYVHQVVYGWDWTQSCLSTQ